MRDIKLKQNFGDTFSSTIKEALNKNSAISLSFRYGTQQIKQAEK
jgi:hypothetical protein